MSYSEELPEKNLLEIEDLCLHIETEAGMLNVLNGVDFTVPVGKTVGIVGESGCGKSMTALAILGLIPPKAKITGGSIRLGDQELTGWSDEDYRTRIRGKRISIIFQDAMAALNPVYTVGNQIFEALRIKSPHAKKPDLKERAMELLCQVQIPSPEKRIKEYPHQLSGGMRQRVMIAMALAAEPELLIADEPTTALDVTIQAQVLEIMSDLQSRLGMSILFITHDMAVVSEICDQVHVMYGGQVVESGRADVFFRHHLHPYSVGLLNCIPQGKTKAQPLANIPGSVKPLMQAPTRCVFADRCPLASGVCWQEVPPLLERREHLSTACFRTDELDRLPWFHR